MQCSHDCNNTTCPFIQDSKNSNRYVCLKCGLERDLNHSTGETLGLIITLVILTILITMLAASCASTKQIPPSPQEIHQKLR